MRILSWNVNGIRTLKQYKPWKELKDFASILNALQADIICFQEAKVSRDRTDSDIALCPDFDAFFSFCKVGLFITSPIKTPPLTQIRDSDQTRQGYSGVTTYVRHEFTPIAAEEGFSGLLKPQSPSPIGCYGNLREEFTTPELVALDSEGRVMITDHRLFVLFNIYFPNDASDERHAFKLRFNRAIQIRVEALINAGRQVIIVGDVNICRAEIDHCDPKKSIRENGIASFEDTPARQWLNSFLEPVGPMVDLFRHYYPDRQKVFTCWNTLTEARVANYGTRIDYILVTPPLLPWFADCTVESAIMGSDHCPVAAVMPDRLPSTESGGEQGPTLAESMGCPAGTKRDPPRLCARYWDEFSGTQKKLSSFFVKKGVVAAASAESGATEGGGVMVCGDVSVSQAVVRETDRGGTHPVKLVKTKSQSLVVGRTAKIERGQPLKGQTSISAFFAKPKGLPNRPESSLAEGVDARAESGGLHEVDEAELT
ncbi:Class II abasic (AP) endonuclease, partial [Borealophlyctis nickersoniae]